MGRRSAVLLAPFFRRLCAFVAVPAAQRVAEASLGLWVRYHEVALLQAGAHLAWSFAPHLRQRGQLSRRRHCCARPPLPSRRPALGRQAASFVADVALRAALVAVKAAYDPFLVLKFTVFMLKFDSVHKQSQRTFAVKEEVGKEFLFVNGMEVITFHEEAPSRRAAHSTSSASSMLASSSKRAMSLSLLRQAPSRRAPRPTSSTSSPRGSNSWRAQAAVKVGYDPFLDIKCMVYMLQYDSVH